MLDELPDEGPSELTIPRKRPSGLRYFLATSLPPLSAFLIQWYFHATVSRWSLFYPAVFVSSWLGGFASGVGATILSTVLVWWFFIPPSGAIVKGSPMHLVAATIFVVMGFIVSTLIRRLRRANRDAALALARSRRVNDRLKRVVTERRLFAAVIETSSDFIGIANAEGKPLYLNPGGRRMVGLPPDFPVEPTAIPDYYPRDLRGFAADVIVKAMIEHGYWHGETLFRHWQTEESIPVSDTHFMVRDPQTREVLGMATITRDISDIKHARDELEAAKRGLEHTTMELGKSRALLQAILDHTPNAVAVKDLAGKYLLINRRLEQLFGWTEADVKGMTDFDLLPRDVAQRFRKLDEGIIEVGRPTQIEEALPQKDGEHVFLVIRFPLFGEHGRFGVCIVWSDITERKRVEAALRTSEEELREAQHVAHVGSWTWDVRRDVVRWSEELYRIFGRDPSLPPPRLLSDDSHIFMPDSLETLRTAVKKTLNDASSYDVDLELVRPDGTIRWVAARGEGVLDPSGNVIGINGTAQDITELKHLQQLREEWISVIAHDLRQPIGVITMSADLLPSLRSEGMHEKETAVTERIRRAAHDLSRMVTDLLDLSLLEAHRLTLEQGWVDPVALVNETVERFAYLTAGHRVTVSSDKDVPKVWVDPLRIEQVLGNLISNAVKYGGKQCEIRLRVNRRPDGVAMSVTNTGPGIPAAELPRIFGRFVRSDAARRTSVKGLGVGLYIARGLIEAHGGRMWAESTPGRTTTFIFTLPRRGADEQAA
jgi:PAS domain S-box-containing protein